MTYKNKAFRRAAAAAAAICLAFAFAFAEETGADRLGFGTSITVSADDLEYNIGTAKITYTTDANGNVTITKFDEGDETSIQIPETIDGGKVKTIGANAFADCSSLTSITLPQSLTNIENLAFARCTALQNINIPQDVTNIGVSAFLRCKSLTNITIPSGVTSIKTSAFALCTSIKSIELPDHLVSIGNSAFTGCYSLESVVIPSVVTSVGEFAFSYCTSLASITLPPSVTSIEDDAFQGCTSLETAFFPRSATLGTGSFPLNTAQIRYTKDSSTGDAMIDRVQTSESSRTSIEIPETICGYEVMSTAEEYRQYVSETGHTHKGGTATCTEKALCDICGNSYDSTDLTNHDADTNTWEYDENGHWNPCLRTGCEEHLNAAAHTFDDGVITTKPTEKTEGVKTYTCTVCGYEKTESIEKLPPKPAAVIYPISISGDVTADRSSAAAGETVTVSAPFGYDIIVTDINGRQIAKFSEKGSFEMPSSRVSITAVRGEIFAHMSNAWNHSYVYSYDSDMNRIKVNSDTKRGMITIDLGDDHAGRSFTIYSGRKSTSKKIISGTLDENGRYTFNADEGRNYTLVIK